MKKISIILKNVTTVLQSKTVLNNISFELNPGENLWISGQSGSGKSLLGKAFSGQQKIRGEIIFKNNGEIFVPSVAVAEQHYQPNQLSSDRIFYYQQRYTGFNADETISVAKALEKYPKVEVKKLLKLFNLEQHFNAPLQQLSSGEFKKFQITKALLQLPDVLILDEPFIGLDVSARQQLKEYLQTFITKGISIIIICAKKDVPDFITHFVELNNGKLVAFDTIKNSVSYQKNKEAKVASNQIPAYILAKEFNEIIGMKNVSVSYNGNQILTAINWQVKRGEKWLVKGPNGAGKSTLLSLVTADNPQSYCNDIILFDKQRGSGESIWDIKKNIGYVSPEMQWYFDKNTTVFQAIASGIFDTMGLEHELKTNEKILVENWINYLQLNEILNHLLSTISTGLQRMVLLARAMVKSPPLLVLDEPCQGLDEQQISFFLTMVNTLCKNQNLTLVYVSHYANEVPASITHVLELENGLAKTLTLKSEIENIKPTLKNILKYG